jgi:hypothetical protein
MSFDRPSSETVKGVLAMLWGVYLVFLILSAIAGAFVWVLFPSVPRPRVIALVLTGPFASVGATVIEAGLRWFLGVIDAKRARAFLHAHEIAFVAVLTVIWVVAASLFWPAK